MNGKGDTDNVTISTKPYDLENWNKFTMVWNGTDVNYYINGSLVGSRNGLSWKETRLLIGGWENDPYYDSGVYWSNVNGLYRNLIFTEIMD